MRLYLSDDTSARAAGADRLAKAWTGTPGLELVRTSSRGAFFLEPMVECDTPEGRIAWPNVKPEDLCRILGGEGGKPVDQIPFLTEQRRLTFANFGVTQPLSLAEYGAPAWWNWTSAHCSTNTSESIESSSHCIIV